ncbi:MAG: hypothetical protein EHM24_32400 [Acidobacteria bacterium]|nr:MAG: hypothetical protein EHM24_32400 [Acidobacteriota bacterium]
MANTPYSVRFLKVRDYAGTSYVVIPPGTRAVLRSLEVSSPSGAGGVMQCQVAGVVVFHHEFLAGHPFVHADLRAVAYEGETIAFYMSLSSMHGYASGYLFGDPGGPGTSAQPHALEQLYDADDPDPPEWDSWPPR